MAAPKEFVIPLMSVAGGSQAGVKVPVMRRGTLNKAHVVQLSGSLDGYSYVFYNTVAACQVPSGNPLTSVTITNKYGQTVTIPIDARAYQITPWLHVPASSSQYASIGAEEDVVFNLDSGYGCLDDIDGNPLQGGSTNQGYAIFMKLIANGTGAKTFSLSLTIEDPMIF